GSMIRKIMTSRVSRRGRKLDRLPWYLTVRGNRGPIRWSQAKRTTVQCRELHGCPPQFATAARLFHASDGTGFADLIIDGHRETWPLRNKRFGAWLRPALRRAHLGCAEPGHAERSAQRARGAGPVRWSAAQRLGAPRRARRPDLPRFGGRVLALYRNRRQRMADRRGPSGQVPPQRRHAAASAPAAGRIH